MNSLYSLTHIYTCRWINLNDWLIDKRFAIIQLWCEYNEKACDTNRLSDQHRRCSRLFCLVDEVHQTVTWNCWWTTRPVWLDHCRYEGLSQGHFQLRFCPINICASLDPAFCPVYSQVNFLVYHWVHIIKVSKNHQVPFEPGWVNSSLHHDSGLHYLSNVVRTLSVSWSSKDKWRNSVISDKRIKREIIAGTYFGDFLLWQSTFRSGLFIRSYDQLWVVQGLWTWINDSFDFNCPFVDVQFWDLEVFLSRNI